MGELRKRGDPSREYRAEWIAQLNVLKADIAAMAAGPERDSAQRRADELESAIHMDGWLRATQLRSPE